MNVEVGSRYRNWPTRPSWTVEALVDDRVVLVQGVKQKTLRLQTVIQCYWKVGSEKDREMKAEFQKRGWGVYDDA